MAISFSRPDPSSPAAVADAAFGTARRGFDQQEVRDFLRMVAAELARLQERERFLERELRAAQTIGVADGGPVIDDDTATRLLGEETARILQAAREGSAAIRAKAEDGAGAPAARGRRGGPARPRGGRAGGQPQPHRCPADAEAELTMAKQQGREMVEEARAYRERVLSELSPPARPRPPADRAARPRARPPAAGVRAGPPRRRRRRRRADPARRARRVRRPHADHRSCADHRARRSSLGDTSSISDDALLVAPDDGAEAEADVDAADDAQIVPFPTPGAGDIEDDEVTAGDVDDLFARLRSTPARPRKPGDTDAVADDVAETPFQRRDAALVPLIVAAARKLKRVLADEQNEVLDTLRRKEPVRGLDVLVPWASEQSDRYVDAIAAELTGGRRGGGDVRLRRGRRSTAADALGPVRERLAADLVAPLRERLERASPRATATTRRSPSERGACTASGRRSASTSSSTTCSASPTAAVPSAAFAPGPQVTWQVDPDGPPSPDCEDNALAGAVTAGDTFPSGHVAPPMHPGCRCLLVALRPVASTRVRRDSDLSGRRSTRRISGRAVLITVGVVFLVVVVFGRAVARFYVDFLWHDGLGRGDVFWGVIGAKLTLFAMFLVAFAVLAGVNLLVADRLSPSRFPANVHPYVERFHELFGHRLRLVRYAGAALLAVMVALPTTSQWQSWLLFRNSESFGIADDQFGADVGFYVFELPFLGFVLDWLFVAMVLVLLLTILAHVLNGGILFASPMPSVRPATKGHIAVLLAVLAALKAADYWVSRYETTNERRGFVQGATYAVVNAQLPALMLLMLIALLTAGAVPVRRCAPGRGGCR